MNNSDFLKEQLERAFTQNIPEPIIIAPTQTKQQTRYEVFLPNITIIETANKPKK